MTTRRRRRWPVDPERPLTPEEREAVRCQGDYLSWVRATHPGAGPGLFTHGVCGGSPLTGKDEQTTPRPQKSQDTAT